MVDPDLLHGWLAGRSVARGLAAPIADKGGFRVDTNNEVEIKRWVFPSFVPGLGELGRLISEPRHTLKICGTIEELRLALPPSWQFEPLAYLMTKDGMLGAAKVPAATQSKSNATGQRATSRCSPPTARSRRADMPARFGPPSFMIGLSPCRPTNEGVSVPL
jgi:hypothetical protein